MSYKPSVEGIKTVLVTLLAKNPKLEEILQLALEEKFMDLAQVLTRYNSRTDFIKLGAAKNIDEIAYVLTDLEKREFEEVRNILPQEIQLFYGIFLTFFDLDNIYSAILSKDKKLTKLIFSRSQEIEIYSKCFESKEYVCLLKEFLRGIKSSLDVGVVKKLFIGSYAKALSCIALLVTSRYCKYVLNANKLGITPKESLQEFIRNVIYKYMPREPSGWLIIAKISDVATYFHEVFKKDPSKVTLYEAEYIYKICKDLLLYSPQLIDLLTLYLINRYYEVYTLKFILPQSRVFR